MNSAFHKKIFTAKLFWNDVGFLILHAPGIFVAFRDKRLPAAFVEKIMTVTTAVNGCVYCSWFHAKKAVAEGISEEEVKNMLNLEFQTDASESELAALLYAQHFAETNRHPDPEMIQKLTEAYGKDTAAHIRLLIRVITFGNLSGNTWDAVLSRFRGHPAENSRFPLNSSFCPECACDASFDAGHEEGQKKDSGGLNERFFDLEGDLWKQNTMIICFRRRAPLIWSAPGGSFFRIHGECCGPMSRRA